MINLVLHYGRGRFSDPAVDLNKNGLCLLSCVVLQPRYHPNFAPRGIHGSGGPNSQISPVAVQNKIWDTAAGTLPWTRPCLQIARQLL